MKARAYDWMYRYWAPWDAVGVRQDLKDLLSNGRVDSGAYPRSVDLGCGSGANVVFSRNEVLTLGGSTSLGWH